TPPTPPLPNAPRALPPPRLEKRSGAPPPPPPKPPPPEPAPSESPKSIGSIPRPNGGIKNEVLATTLKRIFNIARSGRAADAYKKFAELFSSPAFADYEPDEQREALRLMVHAKSSPKSEPLLEAHRSALARLEALVAAKATPADYEML